MNDKVNKIIGAKVTVNRNIGGIDTKGLCGIITESNTKDKIKVSFNNGWCGYYDFLDLDFIEIESEV